MGRDMIEQVVQALIEAVRRLAANLPTVLMALLLYGLLLGALLLFLTTREASAWQVLLGLVVSPLLVVLLFFLAQAFGLTATRLGVGVGYRLKRAVADCSRIMLVTLPLLVLLFGSLQALEQADLWLSRRLLEEAGAGLVDKRWLATIDGARLILLGLVFPLWAIHWWMAAVREGALGALRATARVLRRAFNPGSVLIYLVTGGGSGALAWLIFRSRVPIAREWLELYLFGGRVILGLLVIFLGWLLTLAALGEWTSQRDRDEF